MPDEMAKKAQKFYCKFVKMLKRLLKNWSFLIEKVVDIVSMKRNGNSKTRNKCQKYNTVSAILLNNLKSWKAPLAMKNKIKLPFPPWIESRFYE